MKQIVTCNIETLRYDYPYDHHKDIKEKLNEIIDFLKSHEFVTETPEDY